MAKRGRSMESSGTVPSDCADVGIYNEHGSEGREVSFGISKAPRAHGQRVASRGMGRMEVACFRFRHRAEFATVHGSLIPHFVTKARARSPDARFSNQAGKEKGVSSSSIILSDQQVHSSLPSIHACVYIQHLLSASLFVLLPLPEVWKSVSLNLAAASSPPRPPKQASPTREIEKK